MCYQPHLFCQNCLPVMTIFNINGWVGLWSQVEGNYQKQCSKPVAFVFWLVHFLPFGTSHACKSDQLFESKVTMGEHYGKAKLNQLMGWKNQQLIITGRCLVMSK